MSDLPDNVFTVMALGWAVVGLAWVGHGVLGFGGGGLDKPPLFLLGAVIVMGAAETAAYWWWRR